MLSTNSKRHEQQAAKDIVNDGHEQKGIQALAAPETSNIEITSQANQEDIGSESD